MRNLKIFSLPTIFISIFIIFLVFKSWIIGPTNLSGDSWYVFKSMLGLYHFYPYGWYSTVGNGLGGPGFAFENINLFISIPFAIARIFNLSWETTTRIFLYLPFIPLSIFSSSFLFLKFFPKNRFWVLSPIIYTANSYILMVVGGGQIVLGLSYSLAPLVLYSFMNLLNSSKINIQKITATGLLFGFQTILDLRFAYITFVAAALFYLYSLIQEFKLEPVFRKTAKLVLIIIITGLINSFWLIPILVYRIDPIAQLGTAYSSSAMVKFFGFAKLENSLGLMHPYWPENIFGKTGFMKPEFLLLPLIAFSALLFLGKNKKDLKIITFFGILGILGAFLGKGASDPFGNLYLWLFTHVPGFQLFRDSFKWYTLIAISYMILIPYSLESFSNFISQKIDKRISYSLVFVGFTAILILMLRPAFFGQLSGTFKSREVPKDYKELEHYLDSDKNFYRTLWAPNTMLFGYYTNSHPQISARDFLNEYNQMPLVQKIDKSEKLLEEAGVKYVIVPEDTEGNIFLTDRKYDDSKYTEFVSSVNKILWLKKVKQFGKIVVYETTASQDHFFCDCEAQVGYKFINPTKYQVSVSDFPQRGKLVFSDTFDKNWIARSKNFQISSNKYERFNSFNLPQGSYEFEISYLPQKLVDLGVRISITSLIIIFLGLLASFVMPRKVVK